MLHNTKNKSKHSDVNSVPYDAKLCRLTVHNQLVYTVGITWH